MSSLRRSRRGTTASAVSPATGWKVWTIFIAAFSLPAFEQPGDLCGIACARERDEVGSDGPQRVVRERSSQFVELDARTGRCDDLGQCRVGECGLGEEQPLQAIAKRGFGITLRQAHCVVVSDR